LGVSRARWIQSKRHDVALALLWVPFAVTAHLLENSPRSLGPFVAGVFLISFMHQPLTLGLVYGDRAQFDRKPVLYVLAPLIFVGLVTAGLMVSLVLVAAIAGLWNAEHTLMQRYGITRLYGRKGGDDHGNLEKPMLVSWLVLALVVTAASVRTPYLVKKLGVGSTNAPAVHLLTNLRPVATWLLIPVVAVVVTLAARWVAAERSLGAAANPAKHLYVASTAILFAVIIIDPIAGLVAYVASHAVEYFVIVHRSLTGRVGRDDVSPVARASATRSRRVLLYAGYLGAIWAFAAITYNLRGGDVYRFALLFLGGLHILYDGFIWKLRRPAVAASLGLDPVAA
jgi:hypothetical protein